MIGVVATAPDWGVPTTFPPGDHGGNLDLKDVGPGATISLPVSCPAGCSSSATATRRRETVSSAAPHSDAGPCDAPDRVDEQARIPVPRIETDRELAAVASASTLEAAVATAYGRLAVWLEADFGWNRFEAYSLATQVGRLSVGYFRFGVVAAKIDRAYAAGSRP